MKIFIVFVCFVIVGCEVNGPGITSPISYQIDGIEIGEKTDHAAVKLSKISGDVYASTNGYFFSSATDEFTAFSGYAGCVVSVQRKSRESYFSALNRQIYTTGNPQESKSNFSRWIQNTKEMTITNDGTFTITTAWKK